MIDMNTLHVKVAQETVNLFDASFSNLIQIIICKAVSVFNASFSNLIQIMICKAVSVSNASFRMGLLQAWAV